MNNRTAKFLIITIIALSSCSCTFGVKVYFDDELNGKVYNVITNEPISGALVLAKWQVPTRTTTSCIHARVAETDAEGLYHIEPWVELQQYRDKGIRFVTIYTTAHKKGFFRTAGKQVPTNSSYIYLEPLTGSRMERIKKLLATSEEAICGSFPEGIAGEINDRILYHKSLYDEAKSITKTNEEKLLVDKFIYRIERIESLRHR